MASPLKEVEGAAVAGEEVPDRKGAGESLLQEVEEDTALAVLSSGRPLIVSTDTVFGIGVSVGHAPTPDDLFRIKGRDRSKAIAWLMADEADLLRYGRDIPGYARTLAKAFWPGGLTLIVKASDQVPAAYCADDGTIALRVPNAARLRQLMRRLGSALATSSANVSGMPPAISADQVDPALTAFAPYLFNSSEQPSGRASTIVKCTGEALEIIRVGDIAQSDIFSVLSD